jgi:MFS family permease
VVACVPALVFTEQVWVVVVGVLLWGAATGVQDSTIKALVADLVPSSRLATAYGAFAAYQAVAALAGGLLAGWLYDAHPSYLVGVIAVAQIAALVLLAVVLAGRRRDHSGSRTPG